MQDHLMVGSYTNGTSPSQSDPRHLFSKQIDTVLDRLAKADVSWRSPFTNFRHNQRTLALHFEDADSTLTALLAGEAVAIASCAPTIEARSPHRVPPPGVQTSLGLADDQDDKATESYFGRARVRGPRRERTYLDVCDALDKEQRTIERELGLHTLYLLMGKVAWSEIGKPDESRTSPLLFLPISLVREDAERRMRYREDEVAFVNHVLLKHVAAQMSDARRLDPIAADFDIDAEGQTFSGIVEHLRAAIPATVSDAMGIDIDPSFVAIAIVKSSNYIMYQDLAGLSERMLSNPSLVRLFTADELSGFDEAAAFEERRALLDARPSVETVNVLDLDSSQQVALAKAADGDSFILQGPPGTGKSQTIANIIAQTLYEGRTVLFASKKQEALDVVERRLEEAGLGNYLLTMHAVRSSTKAEMIHRLQELLARYESLGRDDPDAATTAPFAGIDELRDALNEYGDGLLTPEPSSGQRPYDVLGRVALRAQRGIPDLSRVFPDGIDPLGYAAQDRGADDAVVEQLAGFGADFAGYANNRWFNAQFGQNWERWLRDQHARVANLARAANTVRDEGAVLLAALSVTPPRSTVTSLQQACRFVDHLGTRPATVEQWLSGGVGGEASAAFDTLREAWTRRVALRARLDARVAPGFYAADHAAARRMIGDTGALLGRFADGEYTPERLLGERRSLLARTDPHALGAFEARLSRSGLPLGPTIDDIGTLAAILMLLAQRPPGHYTEASVADVALPALIERAYRSRREYGEGWARLGGRFDPSALGEDLDGLHGVIVNADGFFERRSAAYKGAIDRLQRMRLDRVAPERREALDDLDALRHVRALQHDHWAAFGALASHLPLAPQSDAEWEGLARRGEWQAHLHHAVALTPPALALLSLPDAQARATLAAAADVHAAAEAWRATAELCRRASPSTLPAPQGVARVARAEAIAWCRETHRLLATWSAAVDEVRKHYQPDCPAAGLAAMDADLADAQRSVALDPWLAANGPTYERLFGALWRGEGTDFEHLGGALRWWATVESSPWWESRTQTLLGALRDTDAALALAERVASVRAGLAALQEGCAALVAEGVAGVPSAGGDQTMDAVVGILAALGDDLEGVGLARNIATLRAQAEQRPVLRAYLDAATEAVPPELLRDAWAQMLDIAWIEAFLQRGRDGATIWRSLARFDRPTMESRREQYAARDATLYLTNRARVRQRLDWRIGNAINAAQQTRYIRSTARVTEDMEYLHRIYQQSRTVRDMRLRTRRSVRRILIENSGVVQLLAPCWMMSPTSVTQYIDAGALAFDLVIFDEASQLTTADVLPAVARGKQWIFAGDPQQMPPTDFFQTAVADDGVDEIDEDRVESVLDELKLQPAMLRWHYRSNDEALIAFSNYHFYNGRLITFPRAVREVGTDAEHRAVRWVYVSEGIYGRGGDQRNPREAAEIARLIIAHWDACADRPEEKKPTLGVIALSANQREAIADALQIATSGHDDADAIWRRMTNPESSSFLKNLETIQGNECDNIILGVGYGPGQDQVARAPTSAGFPPTSGRSTAPVGSGG